VEIPPLNSWNSSPVGNHCAKLCFVNNSALVVEWNVPSLVCEWCRVRLSPLLFAALMAVVMRHAFDGTGLIFCVRVYASGFGFIKLK